MKNCPVGKASERSLADLGDKWEVQEANLYRVIEQSLKAANVRPVKKCPNQAAPYTAGRAGEAARKAQHRGSFTYLCRLAELTPQQVARVAGLRVSD